MINKGFTLIELMVTVTIMLIMTAVVFFNYNRFNDSTLLSSFAYDMSLTIREAQVYGVSTLESGSGQGSGVNTTTFSNFSSPYGVYFNSSSNVTPQFLLFIDSNKDKIYDTGDTILQSYTFQRGITIGSLCVSDSVNCDLVKSLSITFVRPDPEATITAVNLDGLPVTDPISSATIFLQNSAKTVTKSVVVSPVGQISVQ